MIGRTPLAHCRSVANNSQHSGEYMDRSLRQQERAFWRCQQMPSFSVRQAMPPTCAGSVKPGMTTKIPIRTVTRAHAAGNVSRLSMMLTDMPSTGAKLAGASAARAANRTLAGRGGTGIVVRRQARRYRTAWGPSIRIRTEPHPNPYPTAPRRGAFPAPKPLPAASAWPIAWCRNAAREPVGASRRPQ